MFIALRGIDAFPITSDAKYFRKINHVEGNLSFLFVFCFLFCNVEILWGSEKYEGLAENISQTDRYAQFNTLHIVCDRDHRIYALQLLDLHS